MRSRWIILVCVLVSLLLHAVFLLASMKVDVTVVLPKPEPKPERLVILLPPDPPPPPEPVDRIGEEEDKGDAINELEAPVEQRTSRELPTEQAMLSTDPIGEEPDDLTPEEPLEPAPKPQPEQAAPKAPQEAPKPQQAASQKLPEAEKSEQAQAQSDTPAEDDTTPEQLAMASPPSPEPAEDKQSTPPAAPPAPKPAGDPAPDADRESDAFGPSVSAEIVAGKVEARLGRQLKMTRPQVNLAGFVDTAIIPLPARAEMRIEIDDTGTPRRVTITRSTGSSSIDRAIELAVYQSWFEPINALNRRDRRETFDFTIRLH